jgi:hypothetical protein
MVTRPKRMNGYSIHEVSMRTLYEYHTPAPYPSLVLYHYTTGSSLSKLFSPSLNCCSSLIQTCAST